MTDTNISKKGVLNSLVAMKTAVTIAVLCFMSSATITGAYMFDSARFGNINRRPFFAQSSLRRVHTNIVGDRITNAVVPLFSASTDEESESEDESPVSEMAEPTSDGVPDISATQEEIDLMSVDWAEMDPLHGIPFDDYDELYLQGKAKGDESLAPNPIRDASYESIMTEWDDSVPTLNHISLVGRVGNPPEARYFDNPLGTGSGSGDNYNNKPNVVVSMSLALPRYYSAWEREEYGIDFGQEETEWYNLEVWGVLGEFALKNVQKGTRIGVVGSIDTDYYRNKQTNLLSTATKVLVQDLDILESKAESDARRNNSYGNNASGGAATYSSNNNYNTNSNVYGGGQQREQERGPSFFTDDDDEDNLYDPSGGAGGSAGGFFDPI